jgi:hypothetical protein
MFQDEQFAAAVKFYDKAEKSDPRYRHGIQGAVFRVQCSGFNVQGAGFRVQGLKTCRSAVRRTISDFNLALFFPAECLKSVQGGRSRQGAFCFSRYYWRLFYGFSVSNVTGVFSTGHISFMQTEGRVCCSWRGQGVH